MVEWQNMCFMCGLAWLDHAQYFWCPDCVEWMAERRRFIQDDAA